jgi:phosphatidylinositol 4-kinase type 2
MPRQRPATSGYARLAQADDDDRGLSDDSGDESHLDHPLSTRYAAIQPGPREAMRPTAGRSPKRPIRRTRTNSGVDIKAINARLERWAEEIVHKFKSTARSGPEDADQRLEIHHSVFQAPEGVRPVTAEDIRAYHEEDRMSKQQFEDIVESVRVAIEMGMHPKMISKGSSGSYFARNSDGKVVGVFKPKDEEPYATRNPKWTKWVHRNLFPWFFGRACLIPNLSYVSEAAAYVLDTQLRIDLVPYTDVVYLSSKSFYYDFWERRSTWSGKKSLPSKPGSFQVFLKGFKDANMFLRENPWPDQNTADFRPDMEHKSKRRAFANCIPGGQVSDDEEDAPRLSSPSPQLSQRFQWTPKLKQSFREELEKLVILDYIMRNTDRGLDNWMIRIDQKKEEVTMVAEPPAANGSLATGESTPRATSPSQRTESNTSRPYRRYEAMESSSRTGTPIPAEQNTATVKLGAIDNSLSWPWKHPDAWRSYPFGWLFLPVSLIGQPFTQKTRDHFLPLLTSTAWWSETTLALRRVFTMDPDFKERMFARQIAVMKGQAWNVVETLKQADHGPLELTRRTRVCVWDDLVDVPVAIPMRASSPEATKRAQKKVRIEQDEMDIGAFSSTAPSRSTPAADLLGSPAMNDLPNPNRFELSHPDHDQGDLGDIGEEEASTPPPRASHDASGPLSPMSLNEASIGGYADMHAREARDNLSHNSPSHPHNPHHPTRPRPRGSHAANRFSFDFSRSLPRPGNRGRSNSTRSGVRQASMNYGGFGDDDLEGDLGYAAASDMEGSKRKVIVERLETVKGGTPFFTWC